MWTDFSFRLQASRLNAEMPPLGFLPSGAESSFTNAVRDLCPPFYFYLIILSFPRVP